VFRYQGTTGAFIDLFVRHEARWVHDVRTSTASRGAVSLSP
jgi:hypothetical protein